MSIGTGTVLSVFYFAGNVTAVTGIYTVVGSALQGPMLALAPASAVSDCVRRRVSEVKDRQIRLLGRRWPTSAHRRLLGWRLARDPDNWRMASVLGRDAPIDFYRLTTPSPSPASPGLPAFSCQRHGRKCPVSCWPGNATVRTSTPWAINRLAFV